MHQPTNNDLLIAVQNQEGAFRAHAQEDKVNFDALHEKMDTILSNQQETLEFMKNVGIGLGIFRFTWNNAAKIGAFIGLLVAIVLVGKYMIAGVLTVFQK